MEERDLVNTSGDSIKISDEVIAVITGIAASETEGVVAVGSGGIAASGRKSGGAPACADFICGELRTGRSEGVFKL
jgi:hypothetical protein